MDKRYQVFLSSTFVDLQDERREVLSALQKAGFFVAGMELFPSDDDDSWEVIKRVIDQSDYYVLVIGGRYGSIGDSGKSYTEMEYDYAREHTLPVLAFVHSDPSSIPSRHVEAANPEKLAEFRAKVERAHSRRIWSTKHELATEVLASLSQTVNMRPRVGWVRGNVAEENREISRRLEDLQVKYGRVRDERDSLIEQLEMVGIDPERNTIAWGTDEVELTFEVTLEGESDDKTPSKEVQFRSVCVAWERIFDLVAQYCIGWSSTHKIRNGFNSFLPTGHQLKSASLTTKSFDAIRIQFLALRLVEIEIVKSESGVRAWGGFSSEHWRLSELALHEYSVKHAVRRVNG